MCAGTWQGRVWPGKPLLNTYHLHGWGRPSLGFLHPSFLPIRVGPDRVSPDRAGPWSLSHSSPHVSTNGKPGTERAGTSLGPHSLGQPLGLQGSLGAWWTSTFTYS